MLASYFGMEELNLMPLLEILGIVGLIMIVLEAALDLKIKKESKPLLISSFVVALLGFLLSTSIISFIIHYFVHADWSQTILYAIPLSIISSAIVIPSVSFLPHDKKEFLILESTFSDILGIMAYYFLIEGAESANVTEIIFNISWNILATIMISLLVGYVLVYVFQKINSQVKLFLIISILLLLYAVGKMLHLSSLLIILVFGLILNNQKVFFRGKLNRWIKPVAVKRMLLDFRLVTVESAFIVRTFFFVVFGASIKLESLFSAYVFLESALILLSIFVIRIGLLRLFKPSSNSPEKLIAPRGLITVLLFYAIPSSYHIPEFDNGILLYVILGTSIIMTSGLMNYNRKGLYDHQTMDLGLTEDAKD